jgi:hypothetical protein
MKHVISLGAQPVLAQAAECPALKEVFQDAWPEPAPYWKKPCSE